MAKDRTRQDTTETGQRERAETKAGWSVGHPREGEVYHFSLLCGEAWMDSSCQTSIYRAAWRNSPPRPCRTPAPQRPLQTASPRSWTSPETWNMLRRALPAIARGSSGRLTFELWRMKESRSTELMSSRSSTPSVSPDREERFSQFPGPIRTIRPLKQTLWNTFSLMQISMQGPTDRKQIYTQSLNMHHEFT